MANSEFKDILNPETYRSRSKSPFEPLSYNPRGRRSRKYRLPSFIKSKLTLLDLG